MKKRLTAAFCGISLLLCSLFIGVQVKAQTTVIGKQVDTPFQASASAETLNFGDEGAITFAPVVSKDARDRDVYMGLIAGALKFKAPADYTIYKISYINAYINQRTFFEVYNDKGIQVDKEYLSKEIDAGASHTEYTRLTPGENYYLVASTENDEALTKADVRFRVEGVPDDVADLLADAKPIELGQPYTYKAQGRVDEDWFKVENLPGSMISVSLTHQGTANDEDIYVYFRDKTGSVMEDFRVSGAEMRTEEYDELIKGQEYYICVKSQSEASYIIQADEVRKGIEYIVGENATNGGNPYSYIVGNVVMLNDAERPGYIFTGWYLDDRLDPGDKITFLPETNKDDITIYAGWKKFSVKPPKNLKAKVKGRYVTVKFKEVTNATSYQVKIKNKQYTLTDDTELEKRLKPGNYTIKARSVWSYRGQKTYSKWVSTTAKVKK